VTCFLIAPELRGRGLASRLLGEVLLDLTKHGVRRLEAYPKKGERWSAKESWTGPRAMYLNSGFEQVADGEARDVYAIDLTKRAYEGRSTKDE
jgi:GNAT superfamily N-acetyltransferase